jgi:DNA ligase-1
VECSGSEVTTRWGRIGTAGQSKTKDFGTPEKALAAASKQAEKKASKGYVEDGSTTVAAPTGPVVQTSGDLADGESVEVPGSGGRSYTLRNVGDVFSCSCPAWRNQSLGIERRTCKHLRRFRGEDAETERLGSLPAAPVRASKEGAPAVLLANRWDPAVHDPTGWWMSEKLDGVRAWWDGKRFLSRLGNEYVAPSWFVADLPDHPLDGELFAGRGMFQSTVSIARRTDRSKRWESLSYRVFDGPELGGGFEERLGQLTEIHSAAGWRFASVLAHTRCEGPDALVAELARIEGLGGEGLMLRQPGSRYVGGRSDSLLKVKTFFDAEARVLGHVGGAGRHKGRLGALRVELPNGTQFKVGTGFSDAEREAPPDVGAVIVFRYQELTNAGVPRFPTYVGVRHDFDWEAEVRRIARRIALLNE